MLERVVMALMLTLLLPAASQAASFCVAGPGLPPQCLYEDVKDCRRAANAPNLSCIINPDADVSYSGGERYCRIGSSRLAQCLYVDRGGCNNDARRSGEACFDRAIMGELNNPYRLDNRLQY